VRGELRVQWTIEAIHRVLEVAGVELTYGSEPGVKLSKTAPSDKPRQAPINILNSFS